jgi:hypothetical protein
MNQQASSTSGKLPAGTIAGIPANEPVVVAYGMGVDSTAMLVGWYKLGLPRPDAILFADTGSEKPETYAYLPIINSWLASIGYPQVTVVKNASPLAGDKSLYDECVRKSVLPSLAYGGHSCSLKWKVEPQWKWCKQRYGWVKPRGKDGRWAHEGPITKLIGYDNSPADLKRVKNAANKWPPMHRYVFPLVEWGWDRAECKRQIEAAGLPLPGKSACFMCPASKRAEIEELQVAHPELFAKVIHMEERFKARTIREKGKLLSTKGNGRNFDWASIACQPAQVDSGIAPCEEGFDFLGVEIELSVHDELLEAA